MIISQKTDFARTPNRGTRVGVRGLLSKAREEDLSS